MLIFGDFFLNFKEWSDGRASWIFRAFENAALAFGAAKILFSSILALAWLNCAKKVLKVHKLTFKTFLAQFNQARTKIELKNILVRLGGTTRLKIWPGTLCWPGLGSVPKWHFGPGRR